MPPFSFRFGIFLVLLVNLNGECCASLLLARSRRDPLRHDREYESPEISMLSVSPHWLNIQCTVPKTASSFRVFVNCPALQSPCYENCLPTKTCSEGIPLDVECLPDRTAVNCTESTNPDGSRVISLWIDKRSARLHGSWICTSQGIKSSTVNVLPELEEKVAGTTSVIEVPKEQPIFNETENVQPEDIKNAAGVTEGTTKPPYYAITLRRKKYNEDQKLLGDMICLPTQSSRPHSGLWESDVYPNTFIESIQDPSYFKDNTTKFQHFGTFGPSNFGYDQSQIQNLGEFNDMAFPHYFNTVQPNQLWRARSVGAPLSAGNFTANSDRPSNIRSDTGSLKHLNSPKENLLPPPPPNLIVSPIRKDSEELKQFPRITMSPVPTSAAVYDDVASSSTITVKSRDPQRSTFRKEPQLPSLLELEKPPKSKFHVVQRIRMNLAAESGLKVAARISARDKPSVFETLFEDSVVSNSGLDIADFAFPKIAFSNKQGVLFDTILVQTFPSMINNTKTGGLDGDCVLINTDSSFSVISFVFYLEKVISSRFHDISNSAIVDKV
ncbi:hypothetical protein Aperf_G00000030741 [Anoplocephala perfoliata]